MATRIPTTWPEGVDVLAIDLDVRERTDADAIQAMRGMAPLRDVERVLLKIDSTLRGPIRGLIHGALDAFGREAAIIAPAFPEQGRTYRDGRLYIANEPGASLHDILGADARYFLFDDPRQAAQAADQGALLVGSAGLARRLAPPHQPAAIPIDCDGPVVVVAGSPTAVTRAQLARLHALPDVVVLATPPSETRDAGQAAEALAAAVGEWAQQHATPRAVVLTGGATARAVARRLGVRSLRILGELQPGIPLARLQDGDWHGLPAVTKAGGFGTAETLLDVVHALGVSSTRW